MNVLALVALLQMSAVSAGGHSYDAAYAEAMESGKPLLVLVGTDWCPACVQMKNRVVPELQRRGDLDRVSFAMVNSDRQGQLARRLSAQGAIPQLILYRRGENGWRRSVVVGGQSAAGVSAMIDRAVDATPAQAVGVSTP